MFYNFDKVLLIFPTLKNHVTALYTRSNSRNQKQIEENSTEYFIKYPYFCLNKTLFR